MSHFIDLQTAIEMTTRYRAQNENVLDPQYRNQNLLPVCETFTRDAFDTLLSEGDGKVKKVRIYFSMNRELQVRAIIVGVDAQDKDILPPAGSGAATVGGSGDVIIENGQLCPPVCPPTSPLNG